jgi:hypothetical protein
VQDRREVAVEVAVLEARGELVGIEVVGDRAADEVAELVGRIQPVDGEDLALAARVERPDQVRADESRCAGDDGLHAHTLAQSSRSTRPTSVA